jgi:hypothetical protein
MQKFLTNILMLSKKKQNIVSNPEFLFFSIIILTITILLRIVTVIAQ